LLAGFRTRAAGRPRGMKQPDAGSSTTVTLPVLGDWSLAESCDAAAHFPPIAHASTDGGALRMAFPTDDYARTAAVAVRQPEPGVAVVEVAGVDDPAPVVVQVARVLGLDVDARPFAALLASDPALAPVAAALPGHRPFSFFSPYEAAVWSVLSHRLQMRQAQRLKDALIAAGGDEVVVDGITLRGLPRPATLVDIDDLDGVPAERLLRARGVAQAALDGLLDVATLRGADPDEAMESLRGIRGIGEFYASLIFVRGTAQVDYLPFAPRVAKAAQTLYGLAEPPARDSWGALTDPWRPFRTWTSVLVTVYATRRGGETSGSR
jgi:DNA-3-methyladenine glycosylase II